MLEYLCPPLLLCMEFDTASDLNNTDDIIENNETDGSTSSKDKTFDQMSVTHITTI